MNFFQAQDNARQNTSRMVVLFALAVICLIGLTNVFIMGFAGYLNTTENIESYNSLYKFDWEIFGFTSLGTIAVIALGSLYKTAQLSAGGRFVAETMGGKLIDQNTTNPAHRVVLNVIEEMAIASGIPVPPVYLLAHEPGINAFAAGFNPSDAVIGITNGAIETLNREEFQGVMAHEFSHILNGDMRLNIRLIGILHGILVIGLIGYFILRSARFSSGRRNQGGAPIMALAAGLMLIGFGGTFFGNLIKSYVSRQREYLADASAVQFTRNPGGIASALSKIGLLTQGSNLENPSAAEISHTFFSNGISSFMTSMFSTHPPLEERINRINPHFDHSAAMNNFDDSIAKKFTPQNQNEAASSEPSQTKKTAAASLIIANALGDALHSIDTIGSPTVEHLGYAKQVISEIPAAIIDAAHEPYGARAVIYSLVIDKDESIRHAQLAHLNKYGDRGIVELTLKIIRLVSEVERHHYLPLVDISLSALHQLSLTQYRQFKENLLVLIKADNKINLFEWALQKIVFQHLDRSLAKQKPPKAKYSNLNQVKKECVLLLSFLAHSEHKATDDAAHAFNTARRTLPEYIKGISIIDKSTINLATLNLALDKLNQLKPLIKPILLKACATCIRADGKISLSEVELLRAISAILDCPMPPVVFKV